MALVAEAILVALPAIGPTSLAIGTAGFGYATGSFAIASALAGAAVYGGLSIALNFAANALFRPDMPDAGGTAPLAKPEDGKVNLRQNVPPLTVVLGRVKKGGDYVFLEEREGRAFHLIVHAAHRIQGYSQHYLHDEAASLDVNGLVIAPVHFDSNVTIQERLGASASTAYSTLTTAFPEIWSDDHRGDGLASTMMLVTGVPQADYLKVFPHQMPAHSAVIDGALVYDPRTEAEAFSRNIALLRLFHLMHPSGMRLSLDDIYLPDWIDAADVCDELVTNRDDETEPRYAGGIWYRYNNDQVEVGRTLDQAGELVIYERGDGKVGVHPGRFVEPDIRLTVDDIISCSYDANCRAANTVLAVRGRYTAPDHGYNTVDAAIVGDPYAGDESQRTRTMENAAVQSHNHCQRLQTIAMTRANAPRVTIAAHYGAAEDVDQRRFVRVHHPPRLNEAIIEITGRPKISSSRMVVEFEGIVVPDTLFDFDAATDEGEPPPLVEAVETNGVPEPEGFDIDFDGSVAIATWDHESDLLTYELQYELTDGSAPPQSVISVAGVDEVRTGGLEDGQEYKFRLRTWTVGTSSGWTSYITATVVADAVAPGQPTGFGSSKLGSNVTLTWTNPNSSNLAAVGVYRGTTNVFGSAALISTLYGGIGAAKSYADNSLSNGTYYWWVKAFNGSGVGSTEVGPQTQTIP